MTLPFLLAAMTLRVENCRTWSANRMLDAIDASQQSHDPLRLLVQNASFIRSASVAYYEGQRYPALERIAGAPDVLSKIFAPKTFTP
ncbi:MAG TPA: hypothetical protein VHT92_07395 [Candidatus Cybelea sp.]|nr:hypothetical protein [Candidatus Cybelea sp.]